MSSKYWIKLYHEILEDPKMGLLPDNVWRRCIELFLMAGELDKEGQLPDTSEIAWRLRQPAAQLEQELFQLQQVGIVEGNEQGWLIIKFAERQAPVSSTERSKYSRQKTKENATNRRIVSNVLPKMWAYPFYKSLPITPGIYRIFCSGSGLSYIGASRNLQQRIKQHLSEMASRVHKMSDDLYIYGPESLKVEILEETLDESELPKLETKWLLKYADTLYNIEKLGKNHRDRIATNRCTDTDTESDKESSPKGEGGNSKKPKKAKDSIPIPDAVKVYQTIARRLPDKVLWPEIELKVGATPECLDRWGKVITAYIGCGWNKLNLSGMLRFYEENRIPSTEPIKNGATNNGTYSNGPKRNTDPDRIPSVNPFANDPALP